MYLADFTISDRQSGMQLESHVTVLTAFTVSAGIAWRAGALVISIRKIFHTFSSVSAVDIVVALEFCNISVFQYYSIGVQ